MLTKWCTRLRQSHPRNDGRSQKLSSRAEPAMHPWRNAGSCTGKSQHLRKPQPQMIIATCNKFRGCKQHRAFTHPIPKTDKPHTPCNRSHQFQGCPPIILLVTTTIKPTGKPAHATSIKLTTLPANLSKCKPYHKRQAAQLCNAAPSTSPTPRIRTQLRKQQQQPELHSLLQTHVHKLNSRVCHRQHINQALPQQLWNSNNINADLCALHAASHNWKTKSIKQLQ